LSVKIFYFIYSLNWILKFKYQLLLMFFFLDEKEPKNSGEDAKGVPRKSDRPPQGQRALRGFSSSPRSKQVFYREWPVI